MTKTEEAVEHLRKVGLPSNIGRSMAKELWGPEATYRVDPWVATTEQIVIPAFLDRSVESFIMLNVPPQVGKSTWSGELLAFWVLGLFPDTRIILITYSDDFSRNRGATVRNMIEAFGPSMFGIDVDGDFRSASDWRIKGRRGGMLSVGIGSQITGRSGDLILIDDVIKNAEEAASPTAKRKHLAEYDSTIRTRLQPGGTILITATRWAEDDLSGSLQERQNAPDYIGDRWTVLSYPAIAEPEEEGDDYEDPLGREIGEELQTRFPRGHFLNVRRSIDAFSFSCLFQQRASVRQGGMFPKANWRYYTPEALPYLEQTIRVWDLAATEGGGDYTVGAKVGKAMDGRWFVLDVQRKRLNANRVRDLVRHTAKADGHMTKIRIEESRDGAGKSVVEFYKNDEELLGYDIDGVRAEGQKEQRAMPYSALQNGGFFWLPAEAEWLKEFINEHRQMMGDGRKPRHDDQIDTVAYAVLEIGDAGPVVFADPYDLLDEDDLVSRAGISNLFTRLNLRR